jgi:hypothetical protein
MARVQSQINASDSLSKVVQLQKFSMALQKITTVATLFNVPMHQKFKHRGTTNISGRFTLLVEGRQRRNSYLAA